MSKNIKIGNDVLQDVDTIKFEDAENPGTFVEFLDTTDANATAGEILNGKTGYVNGTKITGTIPTKTSSDLTASGATVTAPAGYYATAATKTIASGTEGTPTATKGTVSNHSIAVTPSVTNAAGYIEGGTKTGTPVNVAASELVNGNINLTNTSSTDVTNYATAQVVDANLIAGNIKKNITILGIEGSYEGGGGVTPTGTINITSNGSVDVTNYATANVSVVSGYSVTPNSYGDTVEIGGESTGGYSITTNVTGGTASGSTATLPAPNTAQVTITASSGYVLPNSVTVTGASFVYNNSTGVIDLTNATGDITITAVCLAQYTITGNITNGTLTGDSTILAGGTATVTIAASEGYSAPEESAVTVTNATIASYSSGELTLSNPTGNVTVTATCVEGIAKGTILNIDMTGSGTPQQYRVIKSVTSDVVEVLSIADVNSEIAFDSDGTNTYEGKTLDTYLNSTWYDTLSSTAKNALVAKTFTQDSWYTSTSGNPDYQGKYYYEGEGAYQMSLGNAAYGNSITRNVYALSMQDIIDYLGVTPQMTQSNTTLTYNNIWQMYWNDTTSHSNQRIWLRSAIANNSGYAARVYGGTGNVGYEYAYQSYRTRAAFQVDLTKISWTK